MSSPSVQDEIPVLLAGDTAAAAITGAMRGRVVAVYRSSFYVDTGRGYVCIGNKALEPSPLTCISAAPDRTDWRASGIRTGDAARLSGEVLIVGAQIRFGLRDTKPWAPDRPCGFNSATVSSGLAALRNECADVVPSDGLGRFILPAFRPDDPVTRLANTPIAALRLWLFNTFHDKQSAVPDNLDVLVGLGPGLTPSGDDFFAGTLVALHELRAKPAADALWDSICPHVEAAGNPVSAAHLAAASNGQGGASLHCASAAIMQGRRKGVRAAIAGIAGIGHTSGWDALAGVATVYDVWSGLARG